MTVYDTSMICAMLFHLGRVHLHERCTPVSRGTDAAEMLEVMLVIGITGDSIASNTSGTGTNCCTCTKRTPVSRGTDAAEMLVVK